ncbi:MAG: DUF4405 domain-containing protein, partial [Myxococcales bacterium]|nr:DUF4405 domain-containing protein [Myxococcales bacterium]
MARTPLRKLLRLGTPMVAAAFVITALTGVLLFFHLGERLFKQLHEWIGLAMVVGAALHIAGNWKAMVATLRRPPQWVFAALALVTAAAFVVPQLSGDAGPGGKGGKAAQRLLQQALLSAPLDQLAPVLQATPDELAADLKEAGFTVAGTDASLTKIAGASDRPPREALDVALAGLTSTA